MGATILEGYLPGERFPITGPRGQYGAMCMIGTFSQYGVISQTSAIKVDDDLPLDKAVLVGCGVPTGWGSAVNTANVSPGDTVAIYGIGGIGINAVQGARYAGAKNVIAIDPLENKREKAMELGATHAFATAEEAQEAITQMTRGQCADSAILTVDLMTAEVVGAGFNAIGKGGVVVVTGLNKLFVLVEGSAELTPARLIGSFDPALVLEQGYRPENFSDGPLVRAMRDGGLLYVEELNRVPEETINVLLTVMSEGEINVPRLGRVTADTSFRLVAAMNPYDPVGTSRLSMALYDRTCRISVGYQDAEHERQIVQLAAEDAKQTLVTEAVALARATREHPDLRSGASVRGAIDYARLVPELAELRVVPADDWHVGLDAALTTLSGRVRRHESCRRSAAQVIEEIFRRIRATGPADGPPGGEDRPGE
jgi:NADPH:quinone reductase-like Zn-dependent oxidoreductase